MSISDDISEEMTSEISLSPGVSITANATSLPPIAVPPPIASPIAAPVVTTTATVTPPTTNVNGDGDGSDKDQIQDHSSKEKGVDELLDDLEQAEPSEAQIAVSKLKESTHKLTSALKTVGSDIDSKFNIVDQARSVDSQLGVSKTVVSATTSLGNLFGFAAERAKNILNQDAVKNVSSSLNETLEKTGIKNVVGRGMREVQTLDEEHKVSVHAVGALNSGIDWMANTLQASSSDREKGQQKDDFGDDEWE